MNRNESLSKAYRLTGEAKVAGTIEFMEALFEAEAKFLLFAHHQCVMDTYEDYIKKKNIQYIRIDGKVDPKQRHDRVQKFQSDEKVRVAILSITTCS